MTTAYTSLLGLALPVQGELAGTWGDMVDNAITSVVDVAVAGTQTISGSQTAVTLSVTNGNSSATNLAQVGSGSTGSAQYAIINCTGNPASLLTITAPASSREYTVINATSTSQSVKIVGVGPTTGVTIASGEKCVVAWNGSDYVKVSSSALSGTLTVSQGGTGLTSVTANYVPYGNGTSPLQTSANFQFDGTVQRVGSNALLGGTTNPVAGFTGGTNNYIQTYVYNATNGASSSADFVAYANNSTDAHGWADMGFTSAGYADATYTVTGPNEAYLFGSALNSSYTGNLVYATDSTGSANAHQWYVGGFTQAKNAWKMQLTSTQLQLAATLAPLGSTSTFASTFLDSNETVNVVAAAPSATTNYYVQSGSVQYYTSNAANNWTLNIAFSSGTSMNTALATGQSVTFTLITTQGSTAYYASAIQIDGTTSGVTTRWIGGAPTAGNASGLDVYRFAVVKTASATYTVLASLTQYKA